MALYALGDLHLHFQAELKAPNQLTDPVWRGHEKRFLKHCNRLVQPDDILLLAGDHSWGRNIRECEADLDFIASLPGKKVLLRGNHDAFWDAKKTKHLNTIYTGKLFFLQNNFVPYKDYAIVGTKGFTFEGPFLVDRYGRILDWDREEEAHSRKLVTREAERLRISFEAAKAEGFRKFIMFLHYPPTSILEKRSVFTHMAGIYGAEQVVYAHCHGSRHFQDSLLGVHDGILYRLVSGDYLNWKPEKILD